MTMKNTDLLALQAYVTATDDSQYDNVRQDTVVLDLTHSNLVQRHVEIRFDLHETLDSLRQRIHQKTGTPASFQHLQVMSGGSIIAEIPPSTSDMYKLGYYGLQHGMTVHCVDLDPHSGSRGGQYEDTSLVKKFVLSEEEYNQRKGTLRDWERQQKKKDANFTLAKHARKHGELCEAQRQAKLGLPLPPNFIQNATTGKVVFVEPDPNDDETTIPISTCNESVVMNVLPPAGRDESSVEGIEVGMRCEVQPGGRRGVVAYCGKVEEIANDGGYWVGIRFDEPVGKTDGMVGNKRYFQASSGFGGFVLGKNVKVGDYPERDIFNELNDNSDDEL